MKAIDVVRKVVKGLAIAVGLPGALLCLMAVVGLLSSNGWLRVGVALVVAVGAPALVADRVLPDDPAEKARGLTSDVFAMCWLGFALLFAVVGHAVTTQVLAREGDRLRVADYPLLASGAYFLAGVTPGAGVPTPVLASASAASAAPSPSGPAPSASPSAAVSASPSTAPSADPAPTDAPGTLTPAEIFKKYAPAVVTINVKGVAGMGGGTGFVLDDKGTIATNHHVIDEIQEAVVKFMNGTVYEEVWILADDPQADLALLSVDMAKPASGDRPDLEPVVVGDSEKIEVGERAVAIGNPLGLEHTLTTGIVSARRTYQGKQWIQMSTPISPGNSGGPVFNERGEVIGVSTASIGAFYAQNLNLAVPINVLKPLIKSDYPAKRKVGKGGSATTW